MDTSTAMHEIPMGEGLLYPRASFQKFNLLQGMIMIRAVRIPLLFFVLVYFSPLRFLSYILCREGRAITLKMALG